MCCESVRNCSWMKYLTVDGKHNGKLKNVWKVTLGSAVGIGLVMLITGGLGDFGIGMACVVGSTLTQVVLMVGGTLILSIAVGILAENKFCRKHN